MKILITEDDIQKLNGLLVFKTLNPKISLISDKRNIHFLQEKGLWNIFITSENKVRFSTMYISYEYTFDEFVKKWNEDKSYQYRLLTKSELIWWAEQQAERQIEIF
ncbi:MAG: hypothetical protein KGV59_06285 [Tenacibaculum sp.]|nr:hypothetical protein [Tenacibaculum sp.]